MRQLKMFVPMQASCLQSRMQFVPLHKDLIGEWERHFAREQDWLAPQKWAVERIYQENLKFCCPECIEKYQEIQAITEKLELADCLRRKYR